MDTIPNRVHTIWLGDGPNPYPDHVKIMRKVLIGWEVLIWGKNNRPNDDLLTKLIESGDLKTASEYYRILLLYKYSGFFVAYNVLLTKHLRPLQVFAHQAGGLVFAQHDHTYTGPDYLGNDVLMAERVQAQYKNSLNFRKHFWARRFTKYAASSVGRGEECGSELLTRYFNDQSAATDSKGRDRFGSQGMVRQPLPQRVWGVQIMSNKYFYGPSDGEYSHGVVLPNLGY